MPDYDVITIGGGLAGGALAKTIAEAGFRVLVLERLLVFRDRVRGEALYPWGVAEASTLGLLSASSRYVCSRNTILEHVLFFDVESPA